MARSPIREWMPFEIDRWFGSLDVQTMRDFQRGWYVTLLLRAWQAEPPCYLPDDEDALMLLAGATSEKMWKEHSAKVLSKFQASGDGRRVNARQLEIYNEKMGIHEKNKKNGSGGGRPRKTETKPNGYESVSDSSSSSSEVVVALGSKPDLKVAFTLEEFDSEARFYALCDVYPKPNRGIIGMQAYQRAIEGKVSVTRSDRNEIADCIEQAAVGYAEAKRGTAKKFIPEMAKWLDAGIWEQDPSCWEDSKGGGKYSDGY